MISSDRTSNSDHHFTNPTTIIFECSDVRGDSGLLLLKRKNDKKFEIHLHNDYTSDAIAMVLSIEDLAKMFETMKEYFLKATSNTIDY